MIATIESQFNKSPVHFKSPAKVALVMEGYEVHTAANGREALAMKRNARTVTSMS